MVPVRKGQPLPLRPAGSVALGPAAALLEDDGGGVVLVWGMATWCWPADDVVSRRLAAVGLVATGAASGVEVAAGFGVDTDTLRRWVRAWEKDGSAALVPAKRGPKGPSKLTAEVVKKARSLRSSGATIAAVGAELGISVDSVRTALEPGPEASGEKGSGSDLVPLARPQPRDEERALARAGLLSGAPPVICEGASQPAAGALLVLPALVVTGLLEVAGKVLGLPRAAFYSARSLILTLVFLALLGEPREMGRPGSIPSQSDASSGSTVLPR